jgi:hypothetical protein
MLFYYKKGDREIGPLDEAGFLAQLRADALQADTLVRTDVLREWVTLEEMLATGVFEQESEEAWQTQRARDKELMDMALSDEPLAELPAEFGSASEKSRAYAEFLARRFNPDLPPGACAMDGKASADERAVIFWEGAILKREKTKVEVVLETVLVMTGPFGGLLVPLFLRQKSEKVAFVTAHDMTHVEAEAIRGGKEQMQRLMRIGAMALVLGLAIFVVGLVFLSSPTPDGSTGYGGFYTCMALAALAIGWGLFLFSKASRGKRVGALRSLEKLPFVIKKLDWVSLRPESTKPPEA